MAGVLEGDLLIAASPDNLVADIFTAKEDVSFDSVAGNPFGIRWEKGSFPDIFELEESHGQPLQPHAETSMGRHAEFENAQIVIKTRWVHVFRPDPFQHRLVSMTSLSA